MSLPTVSIPSIFPFIIGSLLLGFFNTFPVGELDDLRQLSTPARRESAHTPLAGTLSEHPYPPGAKSYNKTKPIRIEEFEPERAWWNHRVENEQAWRVPIEQIRAGNYNLDLKNPHRCDDGPGDVDHLLPEYEKLLAQIAETRAQLKKELHQALTASTGAAE